MAKKICIINSRRLRPAKNKFKAKSALKKIKKDFGADTAFTEYPGHAEKIAGDSSGYDIIIAAGGDGTISEIVNGMNLKNQALAIMPLGSANSLTRDIGVTSITKALKAIEKGKPVKIDLLGCKFETGDKKLERYGVATSGLGFASDTAALANRRFKATGQFCYSISAFFNLFTQSIIRAKIRIDNSDFREIEFTNFLINNTKHSGNARVFPGADLKDSSLNLLFARTNFFTQTLWSLGVITKTYFYNFGTKTAKSLNIELDSPSRFMLDGEIYDSVKKIDYWVIPKGLSILI